ncbi:MAG: nucleotide exchange factor GrpE [Verrucomicrobiota bacterium]
MTAESAKDTTPSPDTNDAANAAPEAATPETNAAAGQSETAAADTKAPADPLAAAQAKSAEAHERYLRTLAEFDNFRRRTIREKEELRQYAASKVLEDLLPALDNLSLGLAAAAAPNADLKSLVGGMTMVSDQLLATLANHGLKQINPVGEPFDPNFHEALTNQPHAEIPEGNVIQVIRTGYTLNGRLLRAASVLVSSGPAAS